eukprot:755145-Hanusia_phi.AAC.4
MKKCRELLSIDYERFKTASENTSSTESDLHSPPAHLPSTVLVSSARAQPHFAVHGFDGAYHNFKIDLYFLKSRVEVRLPIEIAQTCELSRHDRLTLHPNKHSHNIKRL